MTKQEFYQRYFQYAKQSSDLLGGQLDPYIILSFWHWETAGGTNIGAEKLNNLAGINWVDQKKKYGIDAKQSVYSQKEYAHYSSLSEFAKDYARVLRIGWYKDVLKAGLTAGYKDDVIELNESPYAGGDYNINTVVSNANAFKQLAGQPVEIDDKQYITVENKWNLSGEDIAKFVGIGIAIVGVVALIND